MSDKKTQLGVGLRLAWVHIPKAGGTTFHHLLANQFTNGNDFVANNPQACECFANLPSSEKLKFHLVGGHSRFNFDANLPRCFQYFSIVRNPVERVISLYNHWMTSNTTSRPIAAIMRAENWTIEDFIEGGDPTVIQEINAMQHYFCDQPGLDHEARFTQIVSNILGGFAFIAVLEEFDSGLIYLREKYNFTIDYQRMNVTKSRSKTSVSEEFKSTLAKKLQTEMGLYQFICSLHEEKLQTISELDSKLKAFQNGREDKPVYSTTHDEANL